MAKENALQTVSLPASADLSADQFRFVTINNQGRIALTGDGLAADGVLQDAPGAADRAGCVAIGGITKVLLGGTVAKGAQVASDANGKAVTSATSDIILGRCVEGGDDGQIGSIIFQPRGPSA